MKYGFIICYHKDIPWSKKLEKFLLDKVNYFTGPESYKCRSDSASFYRRGLLGYCVGEDLKTTKDVKYTFKRLSRGRRIFGLIPIKELDSRKPLVLDQCMCAIHRGGQRVTLKKNYSEDNFVTFFQTGEIKG